jgi:preprotein translocase subunit SecE
MSKQVAAMKGSLTMDYMKWGLVLMLLGVGIVANYQYSSVAFLYRLLIGMVLFSVAVVVALKTPQGRQFWQFAQAAKLEVQKVVWPNKQETMQSTIGVLVMVAVMGLILWGLDSILLKFVAWLTSYGAS